VIGVYIELLVVLLLAGGIWLDVYSLYVRLSHVTQKRSEGLALANWVLYMARMLNLASAFALALIVESNSGINFSGLVLTSFLVGSLFLFVFYKFRFVESLLLRLMGFVMFMPARGLAGNHFWRPLGWPKLSHVVSSMLISLFLNFAIFLPFVITTIKPEFRMSSVYFGQFMNFISTLLLMLYADPVMMRGRDEAAAVDAMDGFIWGRFASNLLIVALIAIWMAV
jgi:hypothetical protein